MEYLRKTSSYMWGEPTGSEQGRRTVKPLTTPANLQDCTQIFKNWKNIKVHKSHSASPTLIVSFTQNNLELIAKIWFPTMGPKNLDTIYALASEAYIYKHQIPLLLGTAPNSIPRTPCLIEPYLIDSCKMTFEQFRENLSVQPRSSLFDPNVQIIDSVINQKGYQPSQNIQTINMIVTKKSKGTTLHQWFKFWLVDLRDSMSQNSIERLFEDLHQIIFQVIWTLVQLHRSCIVHNDLHQGNILIEKMDQPARNEFYESYNPETCGWLFKEMRHRVRIFDWDRSSVIGTAPGAPDPPFNPITSLEWQPATWTSAGKYVASYLCCAVGQCQDQRPGVDVLKFVDELQQSLSEYSEQYWVAGSVALQQYRDTKIKSIKVMLEKISPNHQTLLKEFGALSKRQNQGPFMASDLDHYPSVVSQDKKDMILKNESFGLTEPMEVVLQDVFGMYFVPTKPRGVVTTYKSISPGTHACNVHHLDRVETMCKYFDSSSTPGYNFKVGDNPKTYPPKKEAKTYKFTCQPSERREEIVVPAEKSAPFALPASWELLSKN